MLTLSLAWRYASRRLVNYVALLALALALAVQIVAGAILDGMIAGAKNSIQRLGTHITIGLDRPFPSFDDFERVADRLRTAHPDDLLDVTPFYKAYALVRPRAGDGRDFAEVWSIDLAGELRHSDLARLILTYPLDRNAPSWHAPGSRPDPRRAPVFMASSLAEDLRVVPGDEIELVYPRRTADGEYVPVTWPCVVTAVFRAGHRTASRSRIYLPLAEGVPFFLGDGRRDANDLAGRPAIPMLVTWLRDPDRAPEMEGAVLETVETALGREGLYANNWIHDYAGLFEAMRNENNLVELVLMLFTFSSGFCLFAILSTLAGRRLRDIGLLRCLGASRGRMAMVFLLVGLWIGALGVGLGTAGGLWLLSPVAATGDDDEPPRARVDVLYERVMGQAMYPPEIYGGHMPVAISGSKIALYGFGALLVTLLSALYPALWAATREPVNALRDD